MKVAVVYNRDLSGVINVSKVQNKETYDPSTVEAVAAALERGGHTVRLIDGNMHIIERLREFMPRVVAGERPGMVFNMAYGIQGVSRYTHLPAMLEMLGVPYVGSNPQAHALALDKIIAKILFQSEGISTPKFWNFASPDDSYPDITFPVIVKPKMEGMSLGIKLVRNAKELRAAVSQIISQFKQHVLVEQFIVGREFTVGLLGNADVEALPVVELDLEGDPKKIRVDEGSRPLRKICPAPLSKAQTVRLQDMARKSFLALGLQDYARIDVRMDEAGTPYVLEINSMADLGRDGAYVFSAKKAGYDFDALINRVLNVAAVRHFGGEAGAKPAVTKRPTRAPSDAEKLAATIRSYVRSQATSMSDNLLRLSELQSPAEILALVEGQLALAGLSRRHKKRGATGDYAFFSNYTGAAPGIILAADVGSLGYRALRSSDDGNRVYGPAEGLGGVAVGMAALRALRFARLLGDLRCGFLLVWGDDPEAQGHPALTSALSRARAVLGLGSSALDGSLVNARAGAGEYQLSGRPGRTMSRVLAAAVVADFMDRLMTLQQLTDAKSGLEVMLSRIDVDSVGAVPQRLEAGFGVRFATSRDGATVDARIRKIADRRAVARVGYDLTGGPQLPPLVASRASRDLLDRIQTLAKEAHAGLPSPRTAGPSRLGALARTRPCVDGFGPAAGLSEAGEPFLLRSSLQDRAVLLALAIQRLSVNGAR